MMYKDRECYFKNMRIYTSDCVKIDLICCILMILMTEKSNRQNYELYLKFEPII